MFFIVYANIKKKLAKDTKNVFNNKNNIGKKKNRPKSLFKYLINYQVFSGRFSTGFIKNLRKPDK